jgi:hypothetical protein
VAEAARARGADGEYSWRLAALVRALLAHPEAVADTTGWSALVADADAAWAAGLTAHATPGHAPDWLRLPSRLLGSSRTRADR